MAPKTVGGYEIIRPLGAGGMGQVLLARDPRLERMVALKVLHRDFAVDPTARKRFQREAKSIASLSHPGIVTIYEIGEDQGRDFIVMEFLGGENLRSLVAGGALEQSEILAIIKQIAEAVAGAHGAGVLHRDIKPENIMVDADAGIKVVDFGLARSFDEVDGGRLPSPSSVIDVMACTLELDLDSNPNIAQTQREASGDMRLSAITETILGTPGYMAPELFIGKSPTTASDIYSLGVVLYEMIAGELPFVASSVDALLQLRVHNDAEAPRLDKRPGVAADVADLVVVMLKKKPEERPTIRSVIDQIQAAQDAATQKLKVLQSRSPALAGLSQEIDVFTPRRRRRALKAASVVTLGTALMAGVFGYRSLTSATPARLEPVPSALATPALERDSLRIAVTPIALDLRTYAHSNGMVSKGAATMLTTILNRADAIHAISPLELQLTSGTDPQDHDAWLRAATESGAMYIATGTLREDGGILAGTFEITNTITREVQSFRAEDRPVSELDSLLLDLANLVVAKLAPQSSIIAPIDAAQRSLDSLELYETALDALNEGRWVDACLHLERIVKEQPEFFEAWYYLAIASAWAAQPTENALRAARKAKSLAHSDRDKDFMQVLIHYIGRDQIKASALAGKLAAIYPKDPEIAYIHAETVYHNGHHLEALRLFNLALDLAPRSRLASVHPIEHSQATGKLSLWRHFRSLRAKKADLGVIDETASPKIRFAMRDYEALAGEDLKPWSMQALSVLGRTKEALAQIPKGQEDHGAYLLYRLARAVEVGNRSEQTNLFAKVWKSLSSDSDVAGNHFRLGFVAGLLIAADLKEELRTFLSYWDLKGAKQIGAQAFELRAHAAVVLGDASMIRSEGFLSWREEMEARALRAELAADHSKAVRIWTELVADPSEHGDNMPRFALARNLAALGDHDRLLAVCSELVYPKLWVPAHPVYRLRCREWGALPAAVPAPTTANSD